MKLLTSKASKQTTEDSMSKQKTNNSNVLLISYVQVSKHAPTRMNKGQRLVYFDVKETSEYKYSSYLE